MTYWLQYENNNEVRSGEGQIEEIYQHPGNILMSSVNITTGECQTYLLQKDVNMRVENFWINFDSNWQEEIRRQIN